MTYHKLLIANRGEIACRIIKTAHEMGISCVAVYTDADSESPFVKLADEAIKLTDTYLNGKEIIEAAIKTKVAEMKEEVQKQYEVSLTEEVANLKSELTERVDSYLEYVAQEWLTENQLSVEHGLKTEMTESFLTGMKSLFEEHYVTIPEEKYDVLNSMVEKLDEMEDKLNEQIERNIALNKRLAESVADVIFSDVCEGLALSQKDKLASLAVRGLD